MRSLYKGKLALGLALLLGACATGPSPTANDITRGRDFDLSNYRQVMIEPVKVSFDEDWEPMQVGSHLELGEPEREEVRRMVAGFFDESFRAELASGGRIEIVDRAGPGVLRITPELRDVYLSAPAPMAQPGSTYVRSVGHLSLNLVFRDAASGQQVLELHDKVRGRDIGLMRTASPVYNRYELTRIFEDWAQVIRQDLFRAP